MPCLPVHPPNRDLPRHQFSIFTVEGGQISRARAHCHGRTGMNICCALSPIHTPRSKKQKLGLNCSSAIVRSSSAPASSSFTPCLCMCFTQHRPHGRAAASKPCATVVCRCGGAVLFPCPEMLRIGFGAKKRRKGHKRPSLVCTGWHVSKLTCIRRKPPRAVSWKAHLSHEVCDAVGERREHERVGVGREG